MQPLSNDQMNYDASGKHINKMHLLDALCSPNHTAEDAEGNPLLHRHDWVRDKEMPIHMMYKYGAPLITEDGCRAYTFNILKFRKLSIVIITTTKPYSLYFMTMTP